VLRNTYFLTTFGHLQASGQIFGTSSLINLIFVIAVFETKNQWKLPMLGGRHCTLVRLYGAFESLHGSMLSLQSIKLSLYCPQRASMAPWRAFMAP
jgi:hypothetical protein